MAFCNSCGTNLENRRKVLSEVRRGASWGSRPASFDGPPSSPVAANPAQSKTLKIVLIVVVASRGVGRSGHRDADRHRFAHRSPHSRDDKMATTSAWRARSEQSNTNSSDVSRDLGVDLYPGARMLKSNGANVEIAGVHTFAAEFESDDPADKVANFYKAKFPNANVSVSSQAPLHDCL